MMASEKKMQEKVTNSVTVVRLYDTRMALQLLDGITLADKTEDVSEQSLPEIPTNDVRSLFISDKMSCSLCCCTFEDRKQQTYHYRSDWHNFNLKQKMRGRNSLSEERFESIADDVSSISGSDSEADSDVEKTPPSAPSIQKSPSNRHPRVFFTNKNGELFSVYRCTLSGKDIKSECAALPLNMKWAVLMAGGGHFAAAIFDADTVLCHKTFHRYVVRAKRGTAQSSRDSHGNAPKSGGATLRRHNEAALTQEIQALLSSWSAQLAACSRIYLRAPSFNKSIFYSGRSPPLTRSDPRVCNIPFATRRPTFSEVKRVHCQLASVYCHGPADNRQEAETDKSLLVNNISAEPNILSEDKISTEFKISTEPEISTEADMSAAPQILAEPQISVEAQISTEQGLTSRNSSHPESPKKAAINYCEETAVTAVPEVKGKLKKKKIKMRKKTDDEDASLSDDPEALRQKNLLYTACRTGDLERLSRALNDLKVYVNPSDPRSSVTSSVERSESHRLEEAGVTTVSSELMDCGFSNREDDIEKEKNGVIENGSLVTISYESILNSTFGRGRTLLHVAASEGQAEVVAILLRSGADPTIKDASKQPPYVAASTKATRNIFRKFMAEFPDAFDYTTSQIPAPISEEQEQEKRERQLEKKRAQHKARRQKQKEMKAEEKKKEDEESERQRFLNLSDREKRALAAERRLVTQLATDHNSTPLSRCWQCGFDITGRVPFVYLDFRFCSPSCLKTHRHNAAPNRT